MLENIKNLDKKYKYTFISTMLIGILAHGFMLTNKISFHDDITCLSGIGLTVSLGRWGLEVLQNIISNTVGKYSMSLWGGIVSLTFIAISACMVVNLLRIKETLYCIMIGALMVVFPTVTMTLFYMFTSGSYFFALFLNVFAVWLLEKYLSIWSVFLAIACIAFSLGIYPAYFPVGISLILFIFLREIVEKNLGRGCREVVIKAFKFLMVHVVGILVYFIITQLFLYKYDTTLSSYNGIGGMMEFSIRSKIKRVLECYSVIRQDIFKDEMGMADNVVIRIGLILSLIFCMTALLFLGSVISNFWSRLFYYSAVIIIPIAINLIYPMTSKETSMSSIMRYSVVFSWILPIYVVDLCGEHFTEYKILRSIKKIVIDSIVVVVIAYVYMNNLVYTKAFFMQEQATSYFTVLITQIKSSEGYKDEMPVAFIGSGHIKDTTLTVNPVYFEGISIVRQDLKGLINEYNYTEYMRFHCGFEPDLIREEDAVAAYGDVINDMPSYPDDGSIKILNETVIVKLGESELY